MAASIPNLLHDTLAQDMSGAPLDDCRSLLRTLPGFDATAAEAAIAQQQAATLTNSRQGRLTDWIVWLAGWLGSAPKASLRIGVHLFAGHNGWNEGRGTARALADMQLRMLALSSGGAAASAIAGSLGAGLHLYDLASTTPSANARIADGMSEIGCARALAFGLECVRHESDVIVVKAMGLGCREVAAALALDLFGGTAADWLAGATSDFACSFATSEAATQAIANRLGAGRSDALEKARRAGAREIAAVIGAIIAARAQRMPVIVEGFAATVALALVQTQQPGGAEHCIVAACDGTPGHARLCQQLNLDPMLDLRVAGIDGVPGLMAAQLLRTAALAHEQAASRTAYANLTTDRPTLAH